MNAFPDDPSPAPIADSSYADGTCGDETPSRPGRGEAPPPHEALRHDASTEVSAVAAAGQAAVTDPNLPRDPAWSGLDVLRLVFLALVALFIGVSTVLFAAYVWMRPHPSLTSLTSAPLVVVAGQALGYVLVLAYMYILVTRERGCPDFFAALHWNWPQSIAPYLLAGVALSLALQLLARVLPMPKNLPIDSFFRTPAEAWALAIFGMTLAPLMEEFFFRGFLYPVLVHRIGFRASIFVTAFAFALLHGSQLMFAWGPVLVIFLVGTVLTMVRAYKNSVAAGLLIHIAYNGTISALMFVATDGFRHLEKLNQ